ncbi:MAG TPA: isochorismatase family cysteine hydrolase [Acidimicrobiales bacterium]|jgi:nicotinamidase-related amidase
MTSQALLVMDLQNGVVDQAGEQFPGLLATLADAVAAARFAGIPVIFVRVAFRTGTPEISPKNLAFSTYAGSDALGETGRTTQIHPALAPQAGEIVVTKKRVSAFAGSDLQLVLRSLGVDSLVLTGVATSGVVLSTLREAADLDYVLTVLRDGCLDRDDEVHRVLMDKVFPRQASVVLAAEWMASISTT